VRDSDRDSQLVSPKITVGDRWRRRSNGCEVEVIDDRTDDRGRVGLREVESTFRYRVWIYDLARGYDRLG
jgi:hypothetical protein